MRQDPKLGEMIANKIYLDMLSSCYDNITDKEAVKYNKTDDYTKVTCGTERMKKMLYYDIYKYQNWKDEADIKADIHQIVLSNSLKVIIATNQV